MTVSLLVPALTRPLPVLQSRARQSESILGNLCNPTRLDPAAYPAVLEPQVQALSPTVACPVGLSVKRSESIGRAGSVAAPSSAPLAKPRVPTSASSGRCSIIVT